MTPDLIVIHHSLTKDGHEVSWGAIRQYHMTAPEYMMIDIGYHGGCEMMGLYYENIVGRMWDEQGAHARGENYHSLGFLFAGNFDLNVPPEPQLLMGAKMLKYWMRLFRIPLDRVRAHRDFADKTCPGKLFDMNHLRWLLR